MATAEKFTVAGRIDSFAKYW